MRAHLFSGWINSALTVLAIYVIVTALPPLINWLFISADWVGSNKDAS